MDIRGGNLSGVSVIDKFRVPNAPIIGTATASSDTTATVTFTAPSFNGNTPITSYTAVSSPGGITGTINQSGSGIITVSGLTNGVTYSFVVYATNNVGNSVNSLSSNAVTPISIVGQVAYTSPATYQWIAPAGVTSVSVVTIGGGGGGGKAGSATTAWSYGGAGGGLAYLNNFNVTPGASYTVVVGAGGQCSATASTAGETGGASYFNTTSTVRASGGVGGLVASGGVSLGGTKLAGTGGGTGGSGGIGWAGSSNPLGGGGGGAAGYSGNGGNANSSSVGNGQSGSGGGGGGGRSSVAGGNIGTGGGGGGVGILGEGTSGAGGTTSGGGGTGGSGGTNGLPNSTGTGGVYGGGGGGARSGYFGHGSSGAVRIIWPGNLRYFPNTRTTDE